MLELKAKLQGRWLEYGDGSRPRSNMIMFDGGDQPKLHIYYVFDWETNEVVTMSFDLEDGDFDRLLDQLLKDGYSSLASIRGDKKFFFEWKLSGDRILIRIEAQANSGFDGTRRYVVEEFCELLV